MNNRSDNCIMFCVANLLARVSRYVAVMLFCAPIVGCGGSAAKFADRLHSAGALNMGAQSFDLSHVTFQFTTVDPAIILECMESGKVQSLSLRAIKFSTVPSEIPVDFISKIQMLELVSVGEDIVEWLSPCIRRTHHVRCVNCTLTARSEAAISENKSLSVLEVVDSFLTPSAFQSMSGESILRADFQYSNVNESQLSWVKHCRKLRAANFSGTCIGDIDLPETESFVELQLNDMRPSVRIVSHALSIKSLRILGLRRSILPEGVASEFRNHKGIAFISCAGARGEEGVVKAICGLKNLVEADFSFTNFNQDCLEELLRNSEGTLTRLGMYGTLVDDRFVLAASGFDKLKDVIIDRGAADIVCNNFNQEMLGRIRIDTTPARSDRFLFDLVRSGPNYHVLTQ